MVEMEKNIENIVENMTVEALCGQVLCFNVDDDWTTDSEIEKFAKEIRPGGLFLKSADKEKCDKLRKIIMESTGIAPILAADVESGPSIITGHKDALQQMAYGAANDPELTEQIYRSCAEICRKNGVNMTFSPVVDLNMNPDNPVTNIRSISENPDLVSKIAAAMVRGFQKDGLVMATCKHFPGDGVDDRNQHFCTTVNSLSAEEWLSSFGKVYQNMFKEDVAAVMVGHIALPALQDDAENDPIRGWLPATLSYSLQTKLLKERLGFEGCIVSDAMSMIGACTAIPIERLSVEFFKAGGDFMLYPLVDDYYRLIKAVKEREIPIERMQDAVRRVLRLKRKARLFEPEEKVTETLCGADLYALSDEMGEKCIKIVRNAEDLLPLHIEEKKRFLIINLRGENDASTFDTVDKELMRRGHSVTVLTNPKHYEVNEKIKDHDVVLVNCKISTDDNVGIGGSLRVRWPQVMPFWRGYIFKHPCVIFTSFGDPYKLYDYPYLKTYVNAFGYTESIQKGFVKVLLGEVESKAIHPVSLKGFFSCEA